MTSRRAMSKTGSAVVTIRAVLGQEEAFRARLFIRGVAPMAAAPRTMPKLLI